MSDPVRSAVYKQRAVAHDGYVRDGIIRKEAKSINDAEHGVICGGELSTD